MSRLAPLRSPGQEGSIYDPLSYLNAGKKKKEKKEKKRKEKDYFYLITYLFKIMRINV
jgi:hypothetical protein